MMEGIKHDLRTLARNLREGDADTYALGAAIVIGILGLWLV